MTDQTTIQVFDSQGDAYTRAFGVFLAHTDQKVNASAWLEREVSLLLRREIFVDAGAGTGKLTAWIGGHFSRTIAIEPNPSLRDELQRACPDAEIRPVPLHETALTSEADFVLCSHVLYYVDDSDWHGTLNCLVNWLRPGGILIVALQNHETDCMRMLQHFTGKQFNLRALADSFSRENSDEFETRMETVQAHVETDSVETAYTVAEFMLNLLPQPTPPLRADVERYVRDFFFHGGRFHFSCHQDFLRIRRKD